MPLRTDRAEPIADKTWDQHQETIIGLYATMKLKEVMEEMRIHHCFNATESQYKGRIIKWKLLKNIRQHEMEQAIDNTGTETLLHGRLLDNKKMKRYLRRRSKQRKSADSETKVQAAEEGMSPTPSPQDLSGNLPDAPWLSLYVGDITLNNWMSFPFYGQEELFPDFWSMPVAPENYPQRPVPHCRSFLPEPLSGLGLFMLMERLCSMIREKSTSLHNFIHQNLYAGYAINRSIFETLATGMSQLRLGIPVVTAAILYGTRITAVPGLVGTLLTYCNEVDVVVVTLRIAQINLENGHYDRSIFYDAFGNNLSVEAHTRKAFRKCEAILTSEARRGSNSHLQAGHKPGSTLSLSFRKDEFVTMKAKADECVPVLLKGFREGRFTFGESMAQAAKTAPPGPPGGSATLPEHEMVQWLDQKFGAMNTMAVQSLTTF